MGKTTIQLNKIYGDFLVLERDFKHPTKGATYWNCQCQKCKRIKSIRADSLKNNPHCRCEDSSKLINQEINNFKVISITNEKASDNSIILKCQCLNCGNIEYIPSNVLRSNRKHCSVCYERKSTLIDMTNQIYGYLQVLYQDMSPEHNGHENDSYWICKCLKCGSIKSIRGISLRNGATKSCGCISSLGEEKIINILKENNILFKTQYGFKDLIYKLPLKFDFAIFNSDGTLSHLIEYDGIQHFERTFFSKTKEDLEKIQFRDKLKDNYCKENNIKLIRIKYDEKITLERIMGNGINDTSTERT